LSAKTNDIVVVADLHCGSRLGLLPPKGVLIDKGNLVKPSPFQLWMWSKWLEFWGAFVPEATAGEPFDVVVNGDAIDGRHHGQDSLITNDLSEQVDIAVACLKAAFAIPHVALNLRRLYFVDGTECHCGLANETTKFLAERFPVAIDRGGNSVRRELWLEIGQKGRHNALVHFLHHIGTTSSAAYETTAVHRELVEAFQEAARWRNRTPDIIVRSHRHRQAKTSVASANGLAIAEVTAGWQGKTPFCFRIAGARQAIPQFGGTVIRSGPCDTYTRSAVWGFARSQSE
jgi:hypothetical protein